MIKTDEQGQKAQEQDLASLVCVRLQDDFPSVLAAYPVISFEKPSGTKYSRSSKNIYGNLKEIKQAIVSYDPHSPFVREMVKTWASNNKTTSHDWLQLISAVLEDGPQLLWKCYWWKEAKLLEQQGKAKGFEASQDKSLGEGCYADLQNQRLYDEHMLSLCYTVALNAWDKI